MSIEASWELVQAALQIFGYIGVTTIAVSIVNSYWRKKREFQKIKNVLVLELEENIFAAEDCIRSILAHGTQTPLLIDDVWRMALSSDQISRFVIPRVDDPLRQLSYVYSRVRDVNQRLTLRQQMSFSVIRTSQKYDEFLGKVDSILMKRLEVLIATMKQARENLSQKDFKRAFMKNMVYKDYAEVAQKGESKSKK